MYYIKQLSMTLSPKQKFEGISVNDYLKKYMGRHEALSLKTLHCSTTQACWSAPQDRANRSYGIYWQKQQLLNLATLKL